MTTLDAEIQRRLHVALPLVEGAGRLALEHFRKPLDVDNKLAAEGLFDPVTVADRGAEALIRRGLSKHWPDSPVLGEEEGSTPGQSEWSWIIDPIDGTRAFISGVPAWGVMLGLLKDGEPVAGIVRQPYLGETFVGDPAGARLLRLGSQIRLRTSRKAELAEAILYTTHPDLLGEPGVADGFGRVSAVARMTRFGGDCYSYCLLAHGLIDLVIESGLQPYDILPLIPILVGAGGVVTNLEGALPLQGGTVVVAATPELHARALELMRR